jgi:hypothetical protein
MLVKYFFLLFIAVVVPFNDTVYIFHYEIRLKYCQNGCILINQQLTTAMENNFVGKRSYSLSYQGAWVR